MIISLFNMALALAVIFLVGYGSTALIGKLLHIPSIDIDLKIVIGFVMTTIYAECYSLFAGVANAALLIIILISAIIYFANRAKINSELKGFFGRLSGWMLLVTLLFGIVFVVISGDVPKAWDDYLYHAAAIRWIEEYGVVPGLANIQHRFAYNSSFMCFQALFSFSGIAAFEHRSFHSMNALASFLLCSYCVCTMSFIKTKKIVGSDLLKLAALFYVAVYFAEISSAGTDYITLYMVAYVFIKAFEYCEKEIVDAGFYGLLAVIGIFSCTLKLSAGLIVLIVFLPLIAYIREKEYKEIMVFAIFSMLIVIPFLIRNVIICGYLLYPFRGLDLFNVDWKLPMATVDIDSVSMRWIAKSLGPAGYGLEGADTAHIWEWLPYWFRTSLSFMDQIIFVACIVGIFIYAIIFIRRLCHRELKRMDFFMVCFIAQFIFWLVVCPLPRYGYMYMLMLMSMAASYMQHNARAVYGTIVVLFLATITYKAVSTYDAKEVRFLVPADYVKGEDVEGHQTSLKDKYGNEVVFYTHAGDHSRTYYQWFPMLDNGEYDSFDNLIFRGEYIKDGFATKLLERE
ncbi:LIC_10190 family membrane protein [Butyrivibrio sp. FC2001]|uniref:LIC_10190 family membrane protein n=1 Tax=Butyrivibrio sp. FC2001 TaxID=1280671 RepID=UPI00041486FB|nr:hypothetical protein [Butyrivibrio sp. FC2001]